MKQNEIKAIVCEAVHETLSGLGISSHEPQEMQADFLYIRKVRKGGEFMSRTIRTSLITITIPTFLYAIWESLKNIVGRG